MQQGRQQRALRTALRGHLLRVFVDVSVVINPLKYPTPQVSAIGIAARQQRLTDVLKLS